MPGPGINVDRNVCIGAGNCVIAAPETFQLDEDGLVVLTDSDVSSSDALDEAERNCPSGAIRLNQGE
jgi:ferredoxin